MRADCARGLGAGLRGVPAVRWPGLWAASGVLAYDVLIPLSSCLMAGGQGGKEAQSQLPTRGAVSTAAATAGGDQGAPSPRPDPSGPWPPEAGAPSNKVGSTVGLCLFLLPLCLPSSFINSLSAHPSLVGDWTNRKLSALCWIKDRAWLITQPWAGVWLRWLPATLLSLESPRSDGEEGGRLDRASLLCGLS